MPYYAKMKSPKNYAHKKLSKINVEQNISNNTEEFIFSINKEFLKIKEISAIVLFGSWARGDYSLRHSDVDLMIFLDRITPDPKIEENIRKQIINRSLGEEINIHPLFQYRKIEEEDKSLMLTIGREGKVIFSRDTLVISRNLLGLKEYFLIKFENAGTKAVSKNRLQRFLYGYKIKGKKYQGIVDEEKVFSAGKGAIILPQELLQKVLLLSKEMGIKAVQKGKFYR